MSGSIQDLAHAAALDALGRLDPAKLPALAVELLLDGVDTPNLTLLAGQGRVADPRDLRGYLHATLEDLGMSRPTRFAAATALKRKAAKEVVEGVVSPRSGAREIVGLHLDVSDETPDGEFAGSGFGIAELLGLYYSYDDIAHLAKHEDAAAVAEIERGIVAACRRIAAGGEG